jgi:23S rRNA (pseudouridine1915-N3)-methyltransferase
MFDIRIIAVGKIKDKNLAEVIKKYGQMSEKYAKIKILEVTPEPFSEKQDSRRKAIDEEGARLNSRLADFAKENVYLLEETGKEFTSLRFVSLLASCQEIVFVIAGPLGFSEMIKRNFSNKLSLSQMTFPHEWARVMLYEQIFRAAAILNGKIYHY